MDRHSAELVNHTLLDSPEGDLFQRAIADRLHDKMYASMREVSKAEIAADWNDTQKQLKMKEWLKNKLCGNDGNEVVLECWNLKEQLAFSLNSRKSIISKQGLTADNQ
jgi:hypothetical protein